MVISQRKIPCGNCEDGRLSFEIQVLKINALGPLLQIDSVNQRGFCKCCQASYRCDDKISTSMFMTLIFLKGGLFRYKKRCDGFNHR